MNCYVTLANSAIDVEESKIISLYFFLRGPKVDVALPIKRTTRKIRNLASAELCATSKYEVVGYLIYK